MEDGQVPGEAEGTSLEQRGRLSLQTPLLTGKDRGGPRAAEAAEGEQGEGIRQRARNSSARRRPPGTEVPRMSWGSSLDLEKLRECTGGTLGSRRGEASRRSSSSREHREGGRCRSSLPGQQ